MVKWAANVMMAHNGKSVKMLVKICAVILASA
jgi:hypothetical protein